MKLFYEEPKMTVASLLSSATIADDVTSITQPIIDDKETTDPVPIFGH